MDHYLTYRPSSRILFLGLFGFFIGIILVALLLLFTLNINENATAEKGEIIAKNSPVKYVAPFEIEEIDMFVQEGSFVKKGDTLAYLKNQAVDAEYKQIHLELDAAKENVLIYTSVLSNLENKLHFLRRGKGTLKGKYDLAVKDNSFEQYSHKKEFKTVQLEYKILQENLKIDSALFADRVIDKRKYDQTYQSFLQAEQKFIQFRKLERQGINSESNITLQYTQELTSQNLKELETEKELLSTTQLLKEQKTKLKSLEDKLTFQGGELTKRHIVAEFDGHIKFLYNEKLESNFLSKGSDLLVLSPESKEEFYAKLEISQRDIKLIKIGQVVHLKLTAYDAFKYGVIKGNISYISESDLDNKFFVLVDIPHQRPDLRLKSGFLTKADVILKRVKLYDYIFRKLFFEGAEYFDQEPQNERKSPKIG